MVSGLVFTSGLLRLAATVCLNWASLEGDFLLGLTSLLGDSFLFRGEVEVALLAGVNHLGDLDLGVDVFFLFVGVGVDFLAE